MLVTKIITFKSTPCPIFEKSSGFALSIQNTSVPFSKFKYNLPCLKSSKKSVISPVINETTPCQTRALASPDPIYRNRVVNMLVNRIMKGGKKSLAYQIIYRAMKIIQQKTETNPLIVLRQAIVRATPDVVLKAKRERGGFAKQVPTEVGSTQGKALAIRWLLSASRKRLGRDMAFKLSFEIVDAACGRGDAIRKKEETHRMAEANRENAHFR